MTLAPASNRYSISSDIADRRWHTMAEAIGYYKYSDRAQEKMARIVSGIRTFALRHSMFITPGRTTVIDIDGAQRFRVMVQRHRVSSSLAPAMTLAI
jgi:hypothetical protein